MRAVRGSDRAIWAQKTTTTHCWQGELVGTNQHRRPLIAEAAAAVDVDDLAGHVAYGVRNQEQSDGRDFLWAADPCDERALAHLAPRFVIIGGGHGGISGARAHGIHANF